jgi:hypothetical protein
LPFKALKDCKIPLKTIQMNLSQLKMFPAKKAPPKEALLDLK